MNWILEFEGFALSSGFVFKEISLRSLETGKQEHFFIRSPCRIENLSRKDLRIVRWCEHNHHCIHWRGGNISISKVLARIRSIIIGTDSKILTKGNTKAEILKKLNFGGSVEDIEATCNLSSVDTWDSQYVDLKIADPCPLRFHRHNKHCSHWKSLVVFEFLKKQKNEFVPEEELELSETTVEMWETEKNILDSRSDPRPN